MTLRHKYMLSLARLAGCAALFTLIPQYSLAAPSCTFTTVTAVGFGAYDVFSGTPNNNGVGSLRIRCQGGGSETFIVRLSDGQSHSYFPRVMRSGANTLTYNLYTSAARNVVWGDGTGGSSTMAVNRNSTTTLSVYGQIPAGQDVAVGIYSDNITATVDF